MIDIARIELARKRKGWLKKDLAENVGIHPGHISRIYSGESENPKTIKAICDVLGLSMEDVYIGERDVA